MPKVEAIHKKGIVLLKLEKYEKALEECANCEKLDMDYQMRLKILVLQSYCHYFLGQFEQTLMYTREYLSEQNEESTDDHSMLVNINTLRALSFLQLCKQSFGVILPNEWPYDHTKPYVAESQNHGVEFSDKNLKILKGI
jgi:tetratricopeptide (TPR) repeat protein